MTELKGRSITLGIMAIVLVAAGTILSLGDNGVFVVTDKVWGIIIGISIVCVVIGIYSLSKVSQLLKKR
jgi:hypothetical protein